MLEGQDQMIQVRLGNQRNNIRMDGHYSENRKNNDLKNIVIGIIPIPILNTTIQQGDPFRQTERRRQG
jgi:hypothetical protein